MVGDGGREMDQSTVRLCTTSYPRTTPPLLAGAGLPVNANTDPTQAHRSQSPGQLFDIDSSLRPLVLAEEGKHFSCSLTGPERTFAQAMTAYHTPYLNVLA